MKVKNGKVLAVLLPVLLLAACQPGGKQEGKTQEPEESTAVRQPVDTTKAVAVFSRNKEDQFEDNDFTVQIFPTGNELVFRLDMRYGMNHAADKLTIPSDDIFKEMAIQPGEDNDHCIVGFNDKTGRFREMIEISGSRTRISMRTLRKYYIETGQ
ncbi:hypothetical protein [Compostibacter hankyongensis]|uniref:Lipoprotein n=1 Tax=Compostibacter hankyongensis TaxID=1007089 RepID=A0ABP8G305_9BACT